MKKRILTGTTLLTLSAIALTGCFGGGGDELEDEIDESGRLVLNLRNLYFSSWDGSDPYTKVIEDKFGVSIEPSSYSYNSWGDQVVADVNGNNIGDVFHFDLESFNFGNTYKYWAEGGNIKALPADLSKWPKIKHIVDTASNINSLKIDGKLYGLPLVYNQNDPDKVFSSFTYVYRRDWVKKIDNDNKNVVGYQPLLRDNDVYTWEEFNNIIEAFGTRADVISGDSCAIGDVSWGFPSLTNFYKDSPHCYSVRNGKVVNAFITDEYKAGLEATRKIIDKGNLYFDQVTNTNNTKAYDNYKGGHMGIYYENLSLSNYSNLRKDIKEISPTISESDLEDRTAIMKVKGPDGKFHLEGSENWFSMTFFNYAISDAKQEKILDILNYLLDEEGTKLAIYGKENQDYVIRDGEVELIEDNWTKKSNGEYATKINGAKYLREMITLNNDTSSYDPFTDQKSYEIINKWQQDMKAAKNANQLVTFAEPARIKWLSTPLKDENTSSLIKEGNDKAMKYCYFKENNDPNYAKLSDYSNQFGTSNWTRTLAEINNKLGY